MKKIKVVLSLLAILAVVSGALAFKALNFTGRVYCTNTTGQIANTVGCTFFEPSSYEENPVDGSSFCTITAGNPCNVKADPPAIAD